jgi:hypothetical protein
MPKFIESIAPEIRHLTEYARPTNRTANETALG